MFNMFQQIFSAIAMFALSLQSLAKASNHLTGWAEEAAGALADEARVQRQQKLNALNAETKRQEQALLTNQAQ